MTGKSKRPGTTPVKNYIDLFYMSPLELNVRDLSLLLRDTPSLSVELWEEMNILELELSNQNNIDFEPLSIASFSSPSDAAFIKNRNIKTIFAISLCDTDLDTVTALFKGIIEKYSGFLCADTQNFMPVYSGSSEAYYK